MAAMAMTPARAPRVWVGGLARQRARVLALTVAIGARALSAHAAPSSLPPEVGYNYAEIETARSKATSGAQRSLSNGIGAIYANPANVVASRVYHVGALLELWEPEASRRTIGLAAVDSVTNSTIGAGLAVNWSSQDPEGVDRDSIDGRLALAMPVSDALAIGFAGRYLKLEQRGLGPLGPSLASSGQAGEPLVREVSFDAAVTARIVPELSLSVVAMNFNNPGHGLLPTILAPSVGVVAGDVTVGVDAPIDFTTWQRTTLRPAFGVEVLLGDHFPLRAGYRFDQGAESHALSGGIGYTDPVVSLELGLRRTVSGEPVTSFGFTFTYHLESAGLAAGGAEGF